MNLILIGTVIVHAKIDLQIDFARMINGKSDCVHAAHGMSHGADLVLIYKVITFNCIEDGLFTHGW